MALPDGHQLKEYRIEDVIGSGGFGITYKALDTQLDKTVAIKEYLPNEFAVRTDATTVQPKSTADQDDYQWGLTRFLDEARTLARFEHPNLNHVHRYFEDNNTAYLVLEYIEGETLSTLLKREGQLETSRLERLVAELLSGLDEVHGAGYVHRDVTPSNIMFRANGSSVLLDFGAARQVLGQRSKNITSILTHGYAPIEQYDPKGDDIGPWTDIYALGMVAYRCVSGINETEFIDAVTRARLARKGKQDQDMMPAVEVGRGHYPSSLLKAIDWAIKVEEEDRPQNVAAIKEMIAGDEVSDNALDAVPVDKPAKQPIKQPSSPKSEQFWIWFWVVAVVPLFVFIVWSAKVERDGREETERVESERGEDATRIAQAERERREKARRAQIERERREEARRVQLEREQREEARRAQLEREQREEATRRAQAERKRREEAERVATAQRCSNFYIHEDYTKVLKWCRLAANRGDAESQNNLGWMYQNGYGVIQNDTEAVKWYRKAVAQGDALGQTLLGTMYRTGRGVAQDDIEAVKWFLKATDQGNADGQNLLGVMYQTGRGVAQDDAEAVHWYRKAAEQGHAWGQYNLGVMYQNGYSVAQSYTEAVKWFRKAAEQEHAWSQYSLGVMYQTGYGVPQSYTEAVKWFRKAAELEDANSQTALGVIYQNGYSVAQSYTEAVKWFRKAAEQGDADAQDKLGEMYWAGKGVSRDYTVAVEWFRKSAEQGHAPGQSHLGVMYSTGNGVAQDYTEAVKWYRKSADQGHAPGQYNLGAMYLEGRGGLRKNIRKARTWFRKAAKQEHAGAKEVLEDL